MFLFLIKKIGHQIMPCEKPPGGTWTLWLADAVMHL